MKRLRYILMIVLSLLVIYSGVGISVCSCFTSEVGCLFCSTPCSDCHHGDEEEGATCDESAASCEDEGCYLNIYKVNLAQQSVQASVSIPSFELFYGLLPDFLSVLPDRGAEAPFAVPPPLMEPRHFLALYSTLLI